MPDHRKHRGPHPDDKQLFAPENRDRLLQATEDLSWLLSHGYATVSSLKIVGDRYGLDARQRRAVARCSCSDESRISRHARQIKISAISGGELWIDGYNLLISVEAALSGGMVLHARDGCYRDLASMHGSYRKVTETVPAIELIGRQLAKWNVAHSQWFLDQPVSNSGRLKTLLRELAETHRWNWSVQLVPDPDPILCRTEQVVASSDSQILDQTRRWLNVARAVIHSGVPGAWVVDLSCPRDDPEDRTEVVKD